MWFNRKKFIDFIGPVRIILNPKKSLKTYLFTIIWKIRQVNEKSHKFYRNYFVFLTKLSAFLLKKMQLNCV